MKFVIAALYKFVRLDDFKDLRQPLLDEMLKHHIKGTLLLAKEGINGTICGSQDSINHILHWLKQDDRLAQLEHKESFVENQAFYRTKVKLKKEIVTMGISDIDPLSSVGAYVEPKDWNALISDPDVVLIDTRNDYEVKIGTFDRAVNPKTKTFREFPDYAKKHLNKNTHKKVAMFCTGGIRCEKSTAYLKEEGFDEVYHLKGGILKYLEEIPKEESLWKGECFVFDQRVAVNHTLEPGQYDQCYACRMPITEEEKQLKQYKKGVSCHHCNEKTSVKQLTRFEEREKQIELAERLGKKHIGDKRDILKDAKAK